MKKLNVLVFITVAIFFAKDVFAQSPGYYNAPYVRYEADQGTLSNAVATDRSYEQTDLQSEASGQVCVSLFDTDASVSWNVTTAGDGLVVRYSIPDGTTGTLDVYSNATTVGTVDVTTTWSWESLWNNGNDNNVGISNRAPKMRFDEVRLKLPSQIPVGGILKLVRTSGAVSVDFAELEPVPAAIPLPSGAVQYNGDGSNLQAFIDNPSNAGKTIYLPAGYYSVDRNLYFGVDNTSLKGAGMWYTQINFTSATGNNGGLWSQAVNVNFSGLYLTTDRNSRSSSYKAINGSFTSGTQVTDIWAEHFECGAWIAYYSGAGPKYTDGLTVSYCRFRNNYADGINLCKGTLNSVVQYCSFRNNGDDDMAIWSQNNQECRNNTYQYCTSENCWRAAGVAIYGGYNNKAQHLLIKDNLEAAIRVNNSFAGAGFNDNGMHEFSDIVITGCGTFKDLYNSQVGAIDLASTGTAGTKIQNVTFSDISITDSRNDAIYINKRGGDGFYNLIFKNISIDGTGKEYPGNAVDGKDDYGRGYGVLFAGYPKGDIKYCNMTYAHRGGNATVNVDTYAKGTLTWTSDCSGPSPTLITSGKTFGICTSPVTFTATTTAPANNTVRYIEFFVDNTSIGQVSTSPYNKNWTSPTLGNHDLKAVAYFSGGTSAASLTQTITVSDGIYTTSVAPVIDGTIDAMWNNFGAFPLNNVPVGIVSNAADLSASFKVARDATNLYILVDVTDNILRNNGPANWQNDGIELYIDMGNDKSGSYVNGNDFQYAFFWGKSTAVAGVTYQQTTKTNNLGYIMEIRIPWLTLGGAQANGTYIGFEIQVEDNDVSSTTAGAGDRQGKLAWASTIDNAWQSTSVLGTLQIAGCNNPSTSVVGFTDEASSAKFYPNPFSTSGTLILPEGNGEEFSVTLVDINGRLIWNKQLEGNNSYTIGEGLNPGMYILEVIIGGTKQTSKLIKL